jgi:peptide/nickel transport system ATP-binding protein
MASIPIPGRTQAGERLGSIPGMVPSLIGDVRGCAFRERCAYAFGPCGEAIAWHVEQGHGWRCILSELPAEAAA